jgi:hypothetical protein
MNFTSFSQNTQKGKESIYEKTPGKIWRFTKIPSVCTEHLRKKPGLAM